MGLELVTDDAPKYISALIRDHDDAARRGVFRDRVSLYRDDYETILRALISSVFPNSAALLDPLIPLVGGTSLVKRIADELARPLYAEPPQRRVTTPDGGSQAQEAFNALAEEMELNERMDTLARLLVPCNTAFLMPRYVEGVGMCLDVITPECVSVVPHPDVPGIPLSITYDAGWDSQGKAVKYVTWDNKQTFTLYGSGRERGDMKPHDFGLIPIVDVHRRGRFGGYWTLAISTGKDLVSSAKLDMVLDLVNVRKVRAQSHIQLAFTGDSDGIAKGQILNELSILMVQGNGQLSPIDLQSDPTAILKLKEASETTLAANYGISRDRLNQRTGAPGDDVGLHERVAELAHVLVRAELALFKVLKQVSREHPKYKIPEDAELSVDLGQIHNRVDRKTQLDVRKIERSMGIRSGVDDVLEDNAEFGGDRARAKKYIEEKMLEEAAIVEMRRALNIPDDVTVDEPGQNAKDNGALGPMVRDGKMSRDEAAEFGAKGAAKEVQAEG